MNPKLFSASISRPRPIVTLVIDDTIREAECSLCGDPLALQQAGRSAEEQKAMLEAVFGNHLQRRFRGVFTPK